MYFAALEPIMGGINTQEFGRSDVNTDSWVLHLESFPSFI